MKKPKQGEEGAAAKPKAAKAPKDKRSKAEIEAEENATFARQLLESWLKMKSFLLLSFTSKPIGDDVEKQFLELNTRLQKQQRQALRTIPRDIEFGSDSIGEIMKSSVSVSHLRSLPESDKRKLYNEWHKIYILLTRAAGAMAFIAEGYEHEVENTAARGMADLRRKTQEVSVPWHQDSSVLTMIGVGVVVAGFLLYYLGIFNP